SSAGTSPALRDRGDHQMHKTFTMLTAVSVLALGLAGCVTKTEYTKAMQSAEARYSALEADNTRLKNELAAARKRHQQRTTDRAELERALTMKAGELGKTIAELRQRVNTLESDNARLTQEVSDAQKARDEKVREVSSTYDQLVQKMKGEI